MLRSSLLLCAAILLSATGPLAAQYVFQQNDNGQIFTDSNGIAHTFPTSNLWTQAAQTYTDSNGNIYASAYTNWTTKTTYPNGAGVSATINGSCHLNESVSFQSLTVGSAGSLAIDSGNTGGAGNHSIAVTMAAGGAGTVQNSGSIIIGAAEQATTITLAHNLTLSGGGVYSLTDFDTVVQGPGTLLVSTGVTLTGTGGTVISAPLANAGVVESADGRGMILQSATATNTGILASRGGGQLLLYGPVVVDNTGGTISAADTNSIVRVQNGVTITGGTLRSFNNTNNGVNGGFIQVDAGGGTLRDFTLATGSFLAAYDGCALVGTVVNNGVLFVPGGGFGAATLTLAGDLTLAGSGILYPHGFIEPADGLTVAPVLTIGPGQTVQGIGTQFVSSDRDVINVSLVNNGTIISNFLDLAITGPSFTNNGTVIATDTGNDTAYVYTGTATTLTNYNPTTKTLTGGTYQAIDKGHGATIYFNTSVSSNDVLVNAATVVLSGPNANMPVINAMTDNRGSFTLLNLRQFSTSADLTNEGTLALDAGTTVHVSGGFIGAPGSTLAVTVGGTQSSGAQSAGVLQVNGAATLGGNLVVTLAPGTQIAATDQIAIGSAASFGGSFANVVNGERLATTDGSGTFQVNYGSASAHAPSTLILSNFEQTGANIIPSFFTGEVNLGSAHYLAFRNGNIFGYFGFLSDPRYIYHFDLGYEYVFDAADGNDGVYLYDFKSSTFFYTSPVFPFPYLYDFSLNATLYYYPDPNNPGRYNTDGVRYFYNFSTGQILTK